MRTNMRIGGAMAKPAERRPTNVSLPEQLVEEARSLGINLSRACESGVEAAVKSERDRRWKLENRAAVDSYNRWIEEHGLPLDEYRTS
jgi:antitoxin CcdA